MGEHSGRGFAGMDPARQREIASMGGRAAHESGRAHEWDSSEARQAGHLGGIAARHHRKAAFHHDTAAHHHRQAAQHEITGNQDEAGLHTEAANEHLKSAVESNDKALRTADKPEDEPMREPDGGVRAEDETRAPDWVSDEPQGSNEKRVEGRARSDATTRGPINPNRRQN